MADQHDVPFDATIDRARTLVADHVARHGAYEITCRGGILVCRQWDHLCGGQGR
ncbi:hypothetical protein [Streptomyces sp. NPDC058718]|uniref:hypothetical protein n=1 Tax=Streptomyces sp. NPDC058718 TaxID=3346610 RepID=UPI003682DD67